MELKDLLVLHDTNGIICINDDNLNCIFRSAKLAFNELTKTYPEYNWSYGGEPLELFKKGD